MNFFSYLLILCGSIGMSFESFACADLAEHKSIPIESIVEDRAKVPILSFAFRDRTTLKLKLFNGLQAYLISDPSLDQSSCALVVKTGSWEDPVNAPGMAHFLEHMLFLGTKKYPKESQFEEFVVEHGGKTNAFTGIDTTVYGFSIDHTAFEEGLDRFAQFFIEPLFNPPGITRELEAIDQEYLKNREIDDWRQYYVYKELSQKEHPNHAFSMGNKQTLGAVSQESLKQWYRDHYSASRMRLIVHSSLPLDELKDLVVEAFQLVPSFKSVPLKTDIAMMPDDLMGKMIYVEPLAHQRRLSLTWHLPYEFADKQQTKPQLIVCHVLGNEGKGGLLAELKRKRLAEGIVCQSAKMGTSHFEFSIDIDLTDAGVKQVDAVILACFQAIAHLKEEEEMQSIFNELSQVKLFAYQYQEREEDLEAILKEASLLAEEELATYPEQSYLLQKFDAEDVKKFISYLTAESCTYMLLAPAVLTKVVPDRQERWLQVAYAIRPIPEETMKKWNTKAPVVPFALPKPNPFLPSLNGDASRAASAVAASSLELVPHPEAVIDSKMAKIYFAQDQRYLAPKISWIFDIKTPGINAADPASAALSMALADLYIKHIEEMMHHDLFAASQAGLDCRLESKKNGIRLTIEGYRDKAKLLCLEVIKSLKRLSPKEHQFKLLKSALLRQYQNTVMQNPLLYAYDLLKSVEEQAFATDSAKAGALRKITFEQFDQFAHSLFASVYIEGTLYGDMTRQEAKDVSSDILAQLGGKAYPKKEQFQEAVMVLPDHLGPYYLEVKAKTQGNVAILCIEALPYSFQTHAALQVFMQAAESPFFASLRTKQQTGYFVFSQLDERQLHLFPTFFVQSHTHEGRDLLARFELFIESFLQDIELFIPQERFESIKRTLVNILQEPPKNVSGMGILLHALAFNYHGDFDRISKRIKGLEQLEYQEFLLLTKQFMGKTNKRRLGLLLKGIIPQEGTLQYQKICSPAELRKRISYEE